MVMITTEMIGTTGMTEKGVVALDINLDFMLKGPGPVVEVDEVSNIRRRNLNST